MKIEGNKVNVQKSAQELYEFLLNPFNFEKLMPDNVETFEADTEGFVFALKGMPKVALKLGEKEPYHKVQYISAKENLDFDLELLINEENDSHSMVQILFEGKFNPFIKMMVEKPLTKFITTLEENVAKLT